MLTRGSHSSKMGIARAASIPRAKNQIDGFFLTNATSSGFVSTGDPVWNAPTFGDYTFADYTFGDYTFGDYTFGDWTWSNTTTWGDWVPDTPGSNPADCTSNNPHVVPGSIVDTVTPGAITPGAVTDGAITDGAVTNGAITDGATTDGDITYGIITYGAVTSTGSAHLYVNGKALN